MSTAQRPEPLAVVERLLQAPQRFGFFQAVRLLERWFVRHQGLSASDALARRIAFRNSTSLTFPASEIETLAGSLTDRIEITPAFMGLLGSGGALPTFYTELIARRETYQRDRAARAFLDVFLQRALTLFYQAWRKHRLPVQFEADRRNSHLPLMLAVAGIGHRGLQGRLQAGAGGVADDALAYFAGSLQRRPMSATAIERLLGHYFRIPVTVHQFIGRWFDLPTAQRSALGAANVRLGHDAAIGERVWQRDLRLRITLGPLCAERFRRFLPGGPGALALRELLALLTGGAFEYEVRLALKAGDVRGTRLSADGAPRLGWNSFLCTRPETRQRCDAGYDLLALS